MDDREPFLAKAEAPKGGLQEALRSDWVADVHYARVALADAKAFTLVNALLEKVSGAFAYLGLTWATVVILSGHASGLDVSDFYVVTVLLLLSASRTLLVGLSSQLIQLWQSGAVNTRRGHVLPLQANYYGVRRLLSSVKMFVMLAASSAAMERCVAMARGGPYACGHPYTSPTIQGALVIYYITIMLETGVMLVAVGHRFHNKHNRVGGLVRANPRDGRLATQAFLWRRFSRYTLDACMTGGLYDGLQMQPVAFLVAEAVFTRRLVVTSAPPSRTGSTTLPVLQQQQRAHLQRLASSPDLPMAAAAAYKLHTFVETAEGAFLADGLINALDNAMPVRDPVAGRERWRLEGLHAQALAAALVGAFAAQGNPVEAATIRYLLTRDPEISYWAAALGSGLEGLAAAGRRHTGSGEV